LIDLAEVTQLISFPSTSIAAKTATQAKQYLSLLITAPSLFFAQTFAITDLYVKTASSRKSIRLRLAIKFKTFGKR
jgi:hypothetical protein